VSDASLRMTQEQIETFLDAPQHAIVVVLRPDGAPQVSPVWFLYEDGRIYFSVLVATAKYRQLSRDPRITLCVDGGHPDARYVTISGTAEFIEEESPWRKDLEWRIVRRYHESDEAARQYEASFEAEGPEALVVVSPERMFGCDYN